MPDARTSSVDIVQAPPKDSPEWMWHIQGLWTSSAACQGLRESFASLDLQTRLSRSFPKLRLVPYFDPTYRGRKRRPQLTKEPVISNNESDLSKGDYQYSPLPPNSIRLLHLEPGKRDHPISCNLVVCQVDDLPTYEALSYTWGVVTVTNTIYCNDLSLRVHLNAWRALRDLRQENESRTLWIDAICINQHDNVEKGAQVQLMRHIYAKANQIPIWIRPVTDDMAPVFSTLTTLSKILLTEDTADRLVPLTAGGLSSRGLPDAKNEIWKAVDSFLWSPWFSRIWIIQEISLAHEAFLVSGSATCRWEDITRAAHFIDGHSLTPIIDVDPSQVLRLESMAETFRDGASILHLAQLARASKATNPRDKIYGLLGLASDGHSVNPNYSADAPESYTTLALQLIQQQQSLAVLNAVEHWANYTVGQNQFRQLPSWVPNWTLFGLSQPLPKTAQLEPSTLIYTVSPSHSQLQVQGLMLATIKDAGDTFVEFIPQAGNSVPEVSAVNWAMESSQKKRWRQWEYMSRKVSAYPTAEPVRSAFIRTLVADSLPEQPPSSADTLESIYHSWVRFWRIAGVQRGRYLDYYTEKTTPEEAQQAVSFMAAHATAAYGRRFFVTREGYFGLGPFQIRRGDCVVGLCGGKTPYVLRRCGGKGSLVEWKVLGECYLHGVRGDILQVDTGFQTFNLR